ncbi:hypothetical protein [Larkinella humicola]|uniref:Uncharacterized protein n=1 Tax=Larkinella humicola TaxID=2607654 RepID=A0A5N1J5X2_9BACT|nr:hypothetical protein [Larkinella humicola]KAA9346316.1 hypothetical protein F0P93_29045 [Larkinella humicola]
MKGQLVAILLVAGVLVCFAAYCYAIFDWVTDYQTGVYQREHFEAFYETSALALYTLLGFRFMNKRMNSL